MPRPYVVKPVNEGSSVGVRIVRRATIAGPTKRKNWSSARRVMVERYVPGREITVAVMGEPRARRARDPAAQGALYDYDAEIRAGRLGPCDAGADPSRGLRRGAATSRLRAHRALGCRGVSRADLRYDDTRGEPGRMVLLEINTQPGMTPTSLVPEIARACRHRLRRAGRLDGGERVMRLLSPRAAHRHRLVFALLAAGAARRCGADTPRPRRGPISNSASSR